MMAGLPTELPTHVDSEQEQPDGPPPAYSTTTSEDVPHYDWISILRDLANAVGQRDRNKIGGMCLDIVQAHQGQPATSPTQALACECILAATYCLCFQEKEKASGPLREIIREAKADLEVDGVADTESVGYCWDLITLYRSLSSERLLCLAIRKFSGQIQTEEREELEAAVEADRSPI